MRGTNKISKKSTANGGGRKHQKTWCTCRGTQKVLTTKRAKKTVQSDTFQGNRRANSTHRTEAKISKKGIYQLAFEFPHFTSKMGPADFRTARKNDAAEAQGRLLTKKSQKYWKTSSERNDPKKNLPPKMNDKVTKITNPHLVLEKQASFTGKRRSRAKSVY